MSLWQTEAWQKMLLESGQIQGYSCIDGCYVEKRRIAFGQYAGFIIGIEKNISDISQGKIAQYAQEESLVFVQVESIFYDNPTILHNNFF